VRSVHVCGVPPGGAFVGRRHTPCHARGFARHALTVCLVRCGQRWRAA
jgi:hypothetical protein